MEDLICYALDEPSLDCFFLTRVNLKERERTKIIHLLKANIEVFTWTPYEMLRIDPNFIKHELNILPDARLVKQRGKKYATEHVDAMIEKVEKFKGGKCNNGGSLSEMVIQHRRGKEEDKRMEGLR